MKERVIQAILNGMTRVLEQEELEMLRRTLDVELYEYMLEKQETALSTISEDENISLLKNFLISKKIEGRSEQTLTFYGQSIRRMLQEVNKNIKDAWGNDSKLKYTRLRYELSIKRISNSYGIQDLVVSKENLLKLNHQEDVWVSNIIPKKSLEFWRPKVGTGKRGIPYIETVNENNLDIIQVPQDGTTGNKRRFPLSNATRTVLSSFDTIDFPHVLAAKEEMKSWKFLQLNPDELRKPTPKENGEDTIDQHGKNLAAALFRIKQKDPYSLIEISRKLNSFLYSDLFPNISSQLKITSQSFKILLHALCTYLKFSLFSFCSLFSVLGFI